MASEALPSVEIPVPIKAEVGEDLALTPPASVDTEKCDGTSSRLSSAPDEDEMEEVVPDHYYNDGQIPVFKPTMKQFESFPKFIRKIDKYGMESGIVKVIPPAEWRDALPALDEQVKTIKVKNPIIQEFHGSHGVYTQANMEKQRSYNLPQWKSVTSESNHQPPAKRGERRRNQEKTTRSSTTTRVSRTATPAKFAAVKLGDGQKRGRGRPRKHPLPAPSEPEQSPALEKSPDVSSDAPQAPLTPASPTERPETTKKPVEKQPRSKAGGSQSVSSRRTHNSAAQVDEVDEVAFREFDYHLDNPEEWTKERCEGLEPLYWKSLNFNNPMYGADMPGSLFDDKTTSWNVAKLESLLDVLGQKVPGVNTAYLYLGMWKATFAWHLEDVDLYSINYIHFGAPKQWYSISQKDARKFERAMKTIWPQDAKNCDQFLRHKTYLVSPQTLKSQYGVEVNKLVHYEGEFVITFPYGYHSGYNLGYNCAESVNFATEAWLDYGKIARKCNCEADSVWVDVFDIERKLRGEPTPEYFEEDYDEDEELEFGDLPTPPSSEKDQVKPGRKRKLPAGASKEKNKRVRLSMGPPKAPVCALCPYDPPFESLLPTEEGKQAHRLCALYIPETYVTGSESNEVIAGVKSIDKKRRELKCLACRNKNGAVFQCSQKKCARAYHPTCAAVAGVSVEIGMTSFYGEDGTEYQDVGIDFRCRFHRAKRPKFPDEAALHEALENNTELFKYAGGLQRGDLVQYQFFGGEIRSGYVLDNNESEDSVLLQTMPNRSSLEVSYKFLLFLEKLHQQLKPPSSNAIPLPAHLAHRQGTSQDDPTTDAPKVDEPFYDPSTIYTWGEFRYTHLSTNPDQKQVVLQNPNTLWHYLGKPSTDTKAHYTHDPNVKTHNPASMFLKTVAPRHSSIPRLQENSSKASTNKKTTPSSAKVKINVKPAVASSSQQPRPVAIAPAMSSTSKAKDVKIKSGIYQAWPQGASVDAEALRNQKAFMASSAAQARHAGIQHMGTNMLHIDHQAQSHTFPSQQHGVTSLSMPGASPVSPEASFMMASLSMTVNTPPSVLSLQREASATHKIWGQYAGCAHFSDWMENRPLVYKSPYGPPGVINEDYLPYPASSKPKTTGLAEAYFLSRSSTEQQVLRPHVRSVSTEKAQLHVQEAERRRLLSDSRPGSASAANDAYFQLPTAAFSSDPHSHMDIFSEASKELHSLADATTGAVSNPLHTHKEPYARSQPPWAPGYDGTFEPAFAHPAQSPYQRAPGHGTRPESGPSAVVKGAPGGLNVNTGPSGSPQGTFTYREDSIPSGKDGTSGSPLRKGRDGVGGETLPVMQDYHY